MVAPKNTCLILTAIACNSNVNLHQIFIKQLTIAGANITKAKITKLGDKTSIFVVLMASWDVMIKLEKAILDLEQQLNIQINLAKPNLSYHLTTKKPRIPYVVHLVTIDRAGILSELLNFFSIPGIEINDICVSQYQANTNTNMISISININIVADMHIPSLREQFISYCDTFNLDAGLEPARDYC